MIKFLLKQFVELTGNPVSSKLLRTFTRSRLSRPLIKPFSRAYHVQESEMEYPINHYHSLQEFFTRRLKHDARTIDQSTNTLISPVDGILSDMGPLSSSHRFYIKDRLYNMREILGSEKKAAAYQHGYFFILYLSPRHYHRIHFPINGTLVSRYALGEKSYPVNSLGTRLGNDPFSTNYRLISELATDFGKVAIVKIGALNINSIHVSHSSTTCSKGEEIGYFSFGSTVLLFVENHAHFQPQAQLNNEVNYGQPIGKWEKHDDCML